MSYRWASTVLWTYANVLKGLACVVLVIWGPCTCFAWLIQRGTPPHFRAAVCVPVCFSKKTRKLFLVCLCLCVLVCLWIVLFWHCSVYVCVLKYVSCLLMYVDVFECLWMSLSIAVFKCLQMSLSVAVFKCLWMSLNVRECLCLLLSLNVFECLCLLLSLNVCQCP